MSLHLLTPTEAQNLAIGSNGFKRLTAATHTAGSGSHTDVTEFVLIHNPTGSNVVFGTGCVSAKGDAPANTDVVAPGYSLPCRLTTVVISSGIAYAYFR